jgi:hypothetical protein
LTVVVVTERGADDTLVAVGAVVDVVEPGAACSAPAADVVVVDPTLDVLVVVDAKDRFDEPPQPAATSANTSASAAPPL